VAKPTFRERVARWLAPKLVAGGRRLYSGAKNSRGSMSFGSGGNASADSELDSSLQKLRARSRQMVRDSAYAKRARLVVVNNVIGSGVGMQAQVGTTRDGLNSRVNDDIETAWAAWADAANCHTGGALHFHDFERAAMGEVFTAGEVFVRKHMRIFGASRVPLALELIEAERIGATIVPTAKAIDAETRMGIEVDEFGRPLAYWIRQRHEGDIRDRVGNRSDKYERVPADDIWHLKITDRWPQTRGEPWLHTVLRKLDDMNEYTGAEVSAARASAYYFATIYRPDDSASPLPTAEDSAQRPVMDIEPLMVQELAPGERLDFHKPDRPNAGLDPFLRYMLREVAAGTGVSYESLSRDYSQANYSSSRLALLDDRDLYKTIQQWWIRNFRRPLHRVWLQQAVLAGAVPAINVEQYSTQPAKFEAALWKPRGWGWVDPTKEVTAYKEAIKAGMTTLTDVIAATANGLDIEDVIATRKRELQMLRDADVLTDTEVMPEPEPVAPAPPAVAENPEPEDDDKADDEKDKAADRLATVVEQQTRAMTDMAISYLARRDVEPAPVVHNHNFKAPDITVHLPAMSYSAAPITVHAPEIRMPDVQVAPPQVTVNVEPADVHVAERSVTVNLPEQAAPVVNVEPPRVVVNLPEQKQGKRVRTVTEWTSDGLPQKVEEIDG
jgi:lambda family phage portal protein